MRAEVGDPGSVLIAVAVQAVAGRVKHDGQQQEAGRGRGPQSWQRHCQANEHERQGVPGKGSETQRATLLILQAGEDQRGGAEVGRVTRGNLRQFRDNRIARLPQPDRAGTPTDYLGMNNVLEKERSKRKRKTEAKHRCGDAAGARSQQSAR